MQSYRWSTEQTECVGIIHILWSDRFQFTTWKFQLDADIKSISSVMWDVQCIKGQELHEVLGLLLFFLLCFLRISV
jgi:hypothetical protein